MKNKDGIDNNKNILLEIKRFQLFISMLQVFKFINYNLSFRVAFNISS